MPKSPLSVLPELLLPWFSQNARDMPWRNTTDPYAIWVSEIMLQQTRVEAVRGYFTRFIDALPHIQALAQVDEEKLLKLWEGLGYYNRAKNLKKAAQKIMQDFHGVFPDNYEAIISLPGIGPYTAGAVSSISFSLAYPAVDGNVLRVCSRFLEDSSCIDLAQTKRQVEKEISALFSDTFHPGTFNQSIMELGATVCLPNGKPLCDICPLSSHCKANIAGTQLQFPVRAEKRKRKIEEKTIFVLSVEDEIALLKSPDSGLLSGLWALPAVNGKLNEAMAIKQIETWGLHPIQLVKSRVEKHIFTHIEWQMVSYYVNCKVKGGTFTWGHSSHFALPTAYRKFLD